MKDLKIYLSGASSETPTTFKFTQPEGCNKVYNCYKNVADDFNTSDIIGFFIFLSSEEEAKQKAEEFKATLPKGLHRYINASTSSRHLNAEGYIDNNKSEWGLNIGVRTSHDYSENKVKKTERLYKEALAFFN